MPLPAALLAKLQKRGIIKEPQTPPVNENKNTDEEVFAEDYDDFNSAEKSNFPDEKVVGNTDENEEDLFDDNALLIREVTACPNKSNPYHTCVDFCRLRWGMKAFEPDSKMLRLRNKMLEKYPLPDGWQEIADPHTSRYYYWNVHTDEICWLSPLHPRAVVVSANDKLRESEKQGRVDRLQLDEKGMEVHNSSDESEGHSSDADNSDDERRWSKYRSSHQRKREKRGRDRADDIDPMDPSAYSKVPRGTWSSGLDQRDSAKTGVDHTVAGPLFQQRPYPSPGAVLRANRQFADKN